VLLPAPPEPPTPEQLAARLRAIEEENKRLTEKLETTTRVQDEQIRQLLERYRELSGRTGEGNEGEGSAEGAAAAPDDNPQASGSDSPVPDYSEGLFTPFNAVPGFPNSNRISTNRFPLKATFGPGFQLQSEDERFRLQIHYESQIESRVWGESGTDSAISGMYLPRQRIFFTGNITKPIEYELAINRGLNNINLLNAFVNFHFDDRFELRIGRFFTPIPYEQHAISNYWLLTPERSVYTTNLGLNRQIGAMAWGYLFEKQLDYAFGVFNGSRNSFENINNAMDLVGFLNVRPFQESEGAWSWARFLNLGTSVAFGHQDGSPVPVAFRIGAGSPDANIPGPATVPFLILNPDVVERGGRLFGSVHAAYFFRGLSLVSEWQYGFGNYTTPARSASEQVPFRGFYVAGGYFLTGEEIARRTRVKPRRPLIPVNNNEQRGPGAWEAVVRVSQLQIGDSIFTAAFADPRLWSNSATTTELGLNWYWNEYTKVYAFWLHGNFGDPVAFRPGDLRTTADMFWLRFQLYF